MIFNIEELSINAWPSLYTVLYDGWLIRLSQGYGNRCNSVNMIYPSKMKAEEKFGYCDEVYARNGLLTAYKIIALDETTVCDEHKDIDKKLEELNYEKSPASLVQHFVIPEHYAALSSPPGVIVKNDFDKQWVESFISFSRIDEKYKYAFKRIIANIGIEKIAVLKMAGDEIAGCGYGAIEGSYLGIFDVVVKEELRGKGYGREIIEALLCEAAKRQVEKSYLQVFSHNTAARHIYEKLGFKEIYRFWFRKKREI